MSDSTASPKHGAGFARAAWWRLCEALASFRIAVVVLVLLCVIVWVGTLAQVEHGLYEVQKKYFESAFLIHWFGIPNPFSKIEGATVPIGIPLPGGFLLLTVLFFNMLAGLILRIRKDWRRAGLLLVHASILFLLAGSWVSFRYKTEGNMALFEGESSNLYRSYTDWSIEVAPAPPGKNEDGSAVVAGRSVLVIPDAQFKKMESGETRRFTAEGLPFEIELHHVMRNAAPRRADDGSGASPAAPVVDGIFLAEQKIDPQAERNVTGAYVTLRPAAGGGAITEGAEGILWGAARAPHVVRVGDEAWTLKMTRRSWVVPFTVRLDKFNRVLHPNTGLAREFSSEVTKTEDGAERKIKIEMNEPLRHEGYTFFQASWGPSDARPGDPLYSVFAVVNNPSDRWPIYTVLIVTIGLLVHFLVMLVSFIRRSSRRREKGKATPLPAQPELS